MAKKTEGSHAVAGEFKPLKDNFRPTGWNQTQGDIEPEFDSSERATEPDRKGYRTARLIQLWNACSEADKKTIERIAQWMAKDWQGELDWS